MATGTKAGFFRAKQPPAVLKHKLLASYLRPAATKLGSASKGGRVVYVDGFAGEPYYVDGSPASAVVALDTAEGLLGLNRTLECLLVEKDPSSYAALQSEVTAYKARGVTCDAFHGEVANHLPALLARSSGVPLFLFLDPCGLGLPYDLLMSVLPVPEEANGRAPRCCSTSARRLSGELGGTSPPRRAHQA
ncbi:MAG: three-Cys-motif partner protein TcmP [Actinomycetota bacterium]|nr:three-Cys-motif partner protein TcmP [Actinomycetota bacterium]